MRMIKVTKHAVVWCESITSLLLPLNFKGSLLVFPLYLKVFSFFCFFNFQLSVTLFVIKVVFCFAMFACVVLHMIYLSVYDYGPLLAMHILMEV